MHSGVGGGWYLNDQWYFWACMLTPKSWVEDKIWSPLVARVVYAGDCN